MITCECCGNESTTLNQVGHDGWCFECASACDQQAEDHYAAQEELSDRACGAHPDYESGPCVSCGGPNGSPFLGGDCGRCALMLDESTREDPDADQYTEQTGPYLCDF